MAKVIDPEEVEITEAMEREIAAMGKGDEDEKED